MSDVLRTATSPRSGSGSGSCHTRSNCPFPEAGPLDERPDPVCLRAAQSLLATHRTLANQPLIVPLAQATSVVVRSGEHGQALTAVRAMLAQLAAAHSPDEAKIAVAAPNVATDFAFAAWLPHVQDPHRRDGAVARRWLCQTPAELAEELNDFLRARVEECARARRVGADTTPRTRLVVVIDEYTSGPTGELLVPDTSMSLPELGVSIVRIVREEDLEPGDVDVRVTVDRRAVELTGPALAAPSCGVLDPVTDADMTVLARTLAPLVLEADDVVEEPLIADTPISTLLGLDDVAWWTPERGWLPREEQDLLRVPFAARSNGRPQILDLKESARGGMGPHGLLVGATGSGKSELLRSLVLGLAATHSPDDLAFVLVDFKGGATFAGLEDLPHVAGIITNLEADLGMVDRMRAALHGELRRRQQLLYDAGNLPNLSAYRNAQRADPSVQPLPHLLVIVDEFAELLTAKPDFIELFTATGRIGRSIGVHQLLASQRLDEGRLRGLESFLSYRLALRTFNPEESRAVLGSPEAFELPPLPGSGYLKVDTTIFERFKAAFVSAPYQRASTSPVMAGPSVQVLAVTNTQPLDTPASGRARAGSGEAVGPTVLDVAVARMRGKHPRVHQIWLSPLPSALTLADLAEPQTKPRLGCPLGLVDLPDRQRQDVFSVAFDGATGHLAVLGGPQSGKSTTVRTLVLSLAATHQPGEIAVHALDFGGGSLQSLAGLPHVGTIASRLNMDHVRRVLADLVADLDRRERLFSRAGINSPEDMRARYARGQLPDLPCADVFLVLDNYTAIRNDHDDLHDQLVNLATRGLAYGVHLIVTAARWHDLRPALQTSISGRVELRLNDPLDSVMDRKLAANIPSDAPGRAIVATGQLAQLALPSTTPVLGRDPLTTEALADQQQRAIANLAALHGNRTVAPIELLPEIVTLAQCRPGLEPAPPWTVTLGLAEDTLEPVTLDLAGEDQHLLVFGDRGSGKTTILRSVVNQLVAAHTDDELVITVVDPRRTLLGAVPESYLGAYAPNQSATAGLASSLHQELSGRQPRSTNPADLANHSWAGPRIVCIVDDVDLLIGMAGNPLMPLLEHLPGARDVGFHLILARHAGGSGRAIYEPLLQRLKELGAPGLVLSGDPSEGQLWPGAAPRPLPPGRGQLVRRGRKPRLIQVALPPHDD